MYHPDVTAQEVAALSAIQLQAAKPDYRWMLTYHTQAVIAAAVRHFDSIYDPDTGEIARPLTFDELRFIENEQKLCGLDFQHFLTNYVHIIGWDKKDTLFNPNLAQQVVLDLWGDSELNGWAIMMQQLKARQLGMTTLTEAAVLHRFQFRARTYAVVASADPFKTAEMATMIGYMWDHQPWWLKPNTVKYSKEIPTEIPELDSKLKPQWGNMYHGVGRGQTPNVVHLSELSSWQDAADDVDSALLKAMHPTPDVFFMMESTALGRDNWWYDEWELLSVEFPAGRSPIRPLFLPWYFGVDIYPTATEARQVPPPRDWVPLDRTLLHAERARKAVLANPLWFKYLAKSNPDWQLPRDQLWYYERERESAVKKKALNKFLAEMPADANEAFQNTNISVIDQDVILYYRETALATDPNGVYTIVGPNIHPSLVVPRSRWDFSKPSLIVNCADVLHRCDEVYQFVPVRYDGYASLTDTGAHLQLWLYNIPQDDETYGIGVDTSDGIGQDASTIEGLRKGTPERAHAQTCEFVSSYIKADQLWPMSLALAVYHSVWQTKTQRRQQCRVAVECMGNGEIVQDEMKKRGWYNFHPWKRLDNRVRIKNKDVHKEGIWTNVWFRAMMMDRLLTAIDEEMLDVWSPWLVHEMETLERDPDQRSARAAYNSHDDRIMALGFILYSLTVDDWPEAQRYRRSQVPSFLPSHLTGGRPQTQRDRNTAIAPPPVYATWQPPLAAQSRSGPHNPRPAMQLERLTTRFGSQGRLSLAHAQFLQQTNPLGRSGGPSKARRS